jgi:hypothetical protein
VTNRKIRTLQSENSKKLDEDGKLLIRQRIFPKPTEPKSKRYRRIRETERRKRQIDRGQLTVSNGLVT